MMEVKREVQWTNLQKNVSYSLSRETLLSCDTSGIITIRGKIQLKLLNIAEEEGYEEEFL